MYFLMQGYSALHFDGSTSVLNDFKFKRVVLNIGKALTDIVLHVFKTNLKVQHVQRGTILLSTEALS